jgi:hypothetical protein
MSSENVVASQITKAIQYRPTDEATLGREICKLADQGLTDRDIGLALRLDPAAVRLMAIRKRGDQHRGGHR